MARHSVARESSNPTARRVVIVGAAILAIVVVAGLVINGLSRAGVGGFCGDRDTIRVAAEPDIADHVSALAEDADGCHEFEVEAVSSADITARVTAREEMPDLWVPDSAVRLEQISREVQVPIATVLNSVASTPVVIASRGAQVDMSTWTAALATPGLTMGDPVRSGIADAPVLAATSEVESMRSTDDALGASMAVLAQGQTSRMEVPPAPREMLDAVIADGGAAVVSEQQAVLVQQEMPDSGLELGVPTTGAVFLTYPLAVTTQDLTRRDAVTLAAEELRDATASEEHREELAADGFRTADRAPLADGAGVGEAEALVVRDPNRVHGTLQRWRLLSLPGRSLVLVDTSGSMDFVMPGTNATRIQALVQTATAGLGQFPDDAALGLWAFGGTAGRDGRPYAEVAPLLRLDTPMDGGSYRDTLAGALGSLPGLVGGETDLYRSVLDAYKMVRDSYDPNAINSIIVISDGANDATSSLDREDFLAQLRESVDPSRPVVVVTLGLLEDADPATLAEISQATGGSSHIARTPDEVVQVFAQAIGQRGGA